ncbi:hypothetical protein DEU56DRAFT_917446 [Suillus clintonianus]|uniref:uncharacterized protein n=1 Tax=Suillus clintonianus TaxID=1904413 RepID=UPI001B872AB6|nr:uncharacterized protein DEU56DRAFT_917446 [Suillus clintonianus]KAG2123485.1 hypothetical protein DEU56DRAFT_917446 [Suillus clintonianus]
MPTLFLICAPVAPTEVSYLNVTLWDGRKKTLLQNAPTKWLAHRVCEDFINTHWSGQTSIKPEQDTGVWEVRPPTWWEIRYESVTWSFDTQHSPAPRLDSSLPSSRLSLRRLPQFLSDVQSRKASKTRVIMDQMRATPSPSSAQGGDRDSDPDSPFSPGNHTTPGRNGWMELPSPTFNVKALVSSSAARSSFPMTSSFPDMPFHIQSSAPPGPFYHLPRAPGYPCSYYVSARAPPPPPPPTSWVPIAAPTYANSMYARPVVW